jgi:hypothetical protein
MLLDLLSCLGFERQANFVSGDATAENAISAWAKIFLWVLLGYRSIELRRRKENERKGQAKEKQNDQRFQVEGIKGGWLFEIAESAASHSLNQVGMP